MQLPSTSVHNNNCSYPKDENVEDGEKEERNNTRYQEPEISGQLTLAAQHASGLKVLSGQFELGARLGSFHQCNKLEARQVKKNLMISREEHKTI